MKDTVSERVIRRVFAPVLFALTVGAVVFNNSHPGDPLPDLIDLFINRPGDIVSLSFRSRADGTLRAAFGVTDGTPGRATVVQTGTLSRTTFGGATGDGFPAERISLKVTGQ